jgi:hypothetical protein
MKKESGEKEMPKRMEFTVIIKDENGEVITTNTTERAIPYIEEIETQGFRASFHELETAILESRKEVSDRTVSEYLEGMSQKKQEVKAIGEKQLKGNPMELAVNLAK